MPQPRTWEGMRTQIVEQLERQTGEDVAAWNERVAAQDPATEPELRAWLTNQGVTGYPQMLLAMERFGYPDYLLAGADDLIDGQYEDRLQLRPVLDALSVMRRQFTPTALAVILLTLAACTVASSQSPSPSPTPSASPSPTIPADAAPINLQGRWSTVLAPGDRAELIIGQNGYSIQRGGASGQGHISVDGDQIEFSRVSNCEDAATYRWAIADDVLTFTPVGPRDPCPRASILRDHEFTRLSS